ncbi:site-specific integrase [Bacillus sp. UMB0893]|uniref:site-specific integrase n=1 Tax=Bacillus sp. UMB0893 TaxID=2066053 RepID=UPI0008A8E239|nr:site-specific integrase [Bacillus sp. UMB0893]OHR74757.1 integrase [Bacillus sp. HMSC76G11]PLR65666.1 site-specific integrase [Bacillus sp. UMB0893]
MNVRKIGANTVEPIRDRDKISEMKEVLLHQSYRNYFLFVFGINSGLRISDIISLRVLDVRYLDYLKVREKKTKKIRKIKMTLVLKTEIEKYIKNMADSDYLFPSRKGDQPISRVQAWKIITDAAKEVGITDSIGTHTLRKTFGYHFYQKTKDAAMLQKIFGHSSPSITLKYIGISDDMIDRALDDFAL